MARVVEAREAAGELKAQMDKLSRHMNQLLKELRGTTGLTRQLMDALTSEVSAANSATRRVCDALSDGPAPEPMDEEERREMAREAQWSNR